jgi:phosphoglycolate phosphatase
MTRPRRFDLIVFDWDGTLFDSTALITRCIQAACADLGTPVPNDRDASYVIGLGLNEALRHAAPQLPPERYGELGLRYRHHYLANHDKVMLFDGTLEMLHGLKFAQPPDRRGDRQDPARPRRCAADRAAARLFDATRTADETASKPHPMMLLELMHELGVAPERTLMIGDTTHDLQLAANAGAASLGVSYGAHEHEAFRAYSTAHVAHSTAELRAWLEIHA